METAVVTGGAGFIGSHLADLLVDEGVEVVAIDNLSTGTSDNVTHLRDDPNFRLVEADIFEDDVVESELAAADAVFHLAADVGVERIVENPVDTIKTNINGTEKMLSLAVEYDCDFLLTSTSEVYGKSSDYPFGEDDDLVIGPPSSSRWCYAASKMVDEHLSLAYAREGADSSIVVTRLFNTVGARQTGDYGMVVPTFVEQALAGEPITVYGDGSQQRAFTAVDDVVKALYELMIDPEIDGEVFNVGRTEEVTILELAERIRDRTGSDSEIQFVEYEDAYEEGFEDPDRRLPDISKAIERIGYRPKKDLDDIIDDVIAEHAE